jgi:hypothetical protein
VNRTIDGVGDPIETVHRVAGMLFKSE